MMKNRSAKIIWNKSGSDIYLVKLQIKFSTSAINIFIFYLFFSIWHFLFFVFYFYSISHVLDTLLEDYSRKHSI